MMRSGLECHSKRAPSKEMYRQNSFYDAGKGLIIFLGEEPWFRIDLYAEAFFQVARELGIKQTALWKATTGRRRQTWKEASTVRIASPT